MNKYLFFRTDRIGDFMLSSILIKSIKRNDSLSHITVVCSKKNYNFVKSINFVDEVILYPDKLIDRLKFYFTFINKKFFMSCVLDAKKRSIYASILTNSKTKIICSYKIIYKYIFYPFFTHILIDDNYPTKLYEMKSILKILNYNFFNDDLNVLTERKYEQDFFYDFIKSKNNFILFHLDEKWIYKQYLKSYVSVEPSSFLNLFNVLKKISEKSNLDLLISSGSINNKFTDKFKSDYPEIFKNIFNIYNNKIYFLNDLSFNQLELSISECSVLICCHGAPTHISSAFNKKIIDIIDLSEKNFFDKWSAHFRNYKQIQRSEFETLSVNILNNL